MKKKKERKLQRKQQRGKRKKERKKKEDAEIKKKQKESEGQRLTGSYIDQKTTDPIDTQEAQDHTNQGHGQDNPDSQEPGATSGSTQGKAVLSGMNLIAFKQKEGEEVLDFSTIFYDKEKKRIVKRTEKKVETRGQSGMMITDKNLVHEQMQIHN